MLPPTPQSLLVLILSTLTRRSSGANVCVLMVQTCVFSTCVFSFSCSRVFSKCQRVSGYKLNCIPIKATSSRLNARVCMSGRSGSRVPVRWCVERQRALSLSLSLSLSERERERERERVRAYVCVCKYTHTHTHTSAAQVLHITENHTHSTPLHTTLLVPTPFCIADFGGTGTPYLATRISSLLHPAPRHPRPQRRHQTTNRDLLKIE